MKRPESFDPTGAPPKNRKVKNHNPNAPRTQPEARNTVNFLQILAGCVAGTTTLSLSSP
jgi:hypothetical protein